MRAGFYSGEDNEEDGFSMSTAQGCRQILTFSKVYWGIPW